MTSAISAISASSPVSAISPNHTSAPAGRIAAPTKQEDSVQLSDTAQQYLAARQPSTDNRDVVEQLVRAAAAGDKGALAQLTFA